MSHDNIRFFSAIFLSIAILLGFHFFYDQPRSNAQQTRTESTTRPTQVSPKHDLPPSQHTPANTANCPMPPRYSDRTRALSESPRIKIETDTLTGSINLKGAVLDDLVLKKYKKTTDSNSEHIILLSPENSDAYYGVSSVFEAVDHPKLQEMRTKTWQVLQREDSSIPNTLAIGSPITLICEIEAGIQVQKTFSIDANYLITVSEKILNSHSAPITVQLLTSIQKLSSGPSSSTSVHEGFVGYLDGHLIEESADKLEAPKILPSIGGWSGLTDKFFLVSTISNQKSPQTVELSQFQADTYSIDNLKTRTEVSVIEPNTQKEWTYHIFAGPKIVRLLDEYEQKLTVTHFDLAVDFGWFYFLTKPLFFVLEYLHEILGNLGIAIIVLTILFKIATIPLTLKSIKSMKRMKDLQPRLEQIKKRYADDQMEFLKQQRALFQKEKISPLGGCLPMLLQAPLFFCLYKVFLISIETRHAPFFGWILDLSAPDPTTVFNAFGLIPWSPPTFLQIGIWPLILGVTMWIQQKQSSQTLDPAQAKVMLLMPVIFTVMFASFPSGLVIYWTVSNLLAILQHWVMNRGK